MTRERPGVGRLVGVDVPDVTASSFRNRASRGAASELLACVHLLSNGWHAFRSESASCPFDIAAYRDGVFLRVEVKSITEQVRDTYAPAFVWPVNDEWDLLLVINPNDMKIIEITTHDIIEARNIVRTRYGFPSVTARRTRDELADLASQRAYVGCGGRGYATATASTTSYGP